MWHSLWICLSIMTIDSVSQAWNNSFSFVAVSMLRQKRISKVLQLLLDWSLEISLSPRQSFPLLSLSELSNLSDYGSSLDCDALSVINLIGSTSRLYGLWWGFGNRSRTSTSLLFQLLLDIWTICDEQICLEWRCWPLQFGHLGTDRRGEGWLEY